MCSVHICHIFNTYSYIDNKSEHKRRLREIWYVLDTINVDKIHKDKGIDMD